MSGIRITRNDHEITYHSVMSLTQDDMRLDLISHYRLGMEDATRMAATGGTFNITHKDGTVEEFHVSACPDYRRVLYRRADTGWLDDQGRITFRETERVTLCFPGFPPIECPGPVITAIEEVTRIGEGNERPKIQGTGHASLQPEVPGQGKTEEETL